MKRSASHSRAGRSRATGSLGAAVVVATLAFAPPAAGAVALVERAAAIDAPLRGRELPGEGTWEVGHARLAPAAGAKVYELRCGAEACGLLVDGPAQLTYRVDDRFSAPVAERNFRRVSRLVPRLAAGGEVVVGELLRGAVIWGWDLVAPAPDGDAAAGTRPVASGAGLPDWAARALADRYFAPPSHLLLEAAANGSLQARWALLQAESAGYLLRVDPAAGEETLAQLARVTLPRTTFRQATRTVSLAAQPIGRQWWEAPPQAMVATHTALRVANPEGNQLTFLATSRLRAQHGRTRIWRAELEDRLYDDDGNERRLTVREVRVGGQPAGFLHRDGELLVDLGAAVPAGAEVEVAAAYDGDLAIRPANHSFWVLGTIPWYPRQGLAGERATMEIEVEVPAPFVPFASGAEVSRTDAGGRRRVVTRLPDPMQFAVVLAGKYAIATESRGGLTARAATYARAKEGPAAKVLEKLFSAAGFFENLFDEPYPFRDLAIVELHDWGLGQAPPGILFFTQEFYTAPVERRTRIYFQDLDARFLHEVAHGWWGHVAKMRSGEETWLTEALSEYTAAVALWRLRGGDRGEHTFDELVLKWRRGAGDIAPGASLYLMNRLSSRDDRNREDYWRLRYARGPLVIHAIRLELQRLRGGVEEGDRHFIAMLRAFLERSRSGWGSTEALVATLDELTGRSWQPWFERYVYGTEPPPLPPA